MTTPSYTMAAVPVAHAANSSSDKEASLLVAPTRLATAVRGALKSALPLGRALDANVRKISQCRGFGTRNLSHKGEVQCQWPWPEGNSVQIFLPHLMYSFNVGRLVALLDTLPFTSIFQTKPLKTEKCGFCLFNRRPAFSENLHLKLTNYTEHVFGFYRLLETLKGNSS